MTPPLLDFEGIEDDLVAKTPWGRLGVPDDVDAVVDGGMTLHRAGVDGVLDRMKALLAGANDLMAGLRG